MPLRLFRKANQSAQMLDRATLASHLAQFQMRQIESHPAWLAKCEAAFGVHGMDAFRAHSGYHKLQETIARCLHAALEDRDFHEEARHIADAHQRLQVPLADFLDACQAIGEEALKRGAEASFIPRLRAFVRKVVDFYENVLHEANTQLQLRESSWKSIAEKITEGVFVTTIEDGRILWVNEAFARMLGYVVDNLVGRTWMDLTPPDLLKEELTGKFAKEKQGEIARYEKCFLHKDGSQIPVLISYQAIDGSAFGGSRVYLTTVTDISIQQLQTEALEQERSYWHDIFSALTEGAAIFDDKGRALAANPAFEQMLGYSVQEIQAPHFNLIEKMVDPKDQALTGGKIKEAMTTGELVRFEVPHRHRDGHWIPVLLSFKKLKKNPAWESERLLGLAVDLTMTKRHEKELQDILEYIKVLIERLEQGVVLEDQSTTQGLAQTLQAHYNRAIASLRTLLERTQQTAVAITAAAGQLTQGQKSLSERVESESASLEEIAASLEELSSSIGETNGHVQSLAEFARKMAEQADKSQANMQKMAIDMAEMQKQANTMQEIIEVVEEIAFQTNLLSLNASVEAARAGQSGSGFAVIATEIRRLANKTSGEAKTIRGWLKNLVHQSEQSTESTVSNAKEVQTIAAMAKEVSHHVDSISAATAEFTQAMRQIQDTSGQLETHVQQNSAMAEEVSSAAEHLTREAMHLQEALAFFQISKEGIQAPLHTMQNAPKPQTEKSASLPNRSAFVPPKDDWEVF